MALTAHGDELGVPRWIALRRHVADLPRSIAFYREGLGFQPVHVDAGRALLRLGDEHLELMGGLAEPVERVAGPDTRFQHAAIVATDLDAALARLSRFPFEAISHPGPWRLPARSGGATAFKFRDPDGHALELLQLHTAGRWSAKQGAGPTLGIDHVAFSVADAERSLAFYARHFGFGVAARQTNHGPEQAGLDGLATSTVDVIALTAAAGHPHVELLAYQQPAPVPHTRTPAWADRVVFAGTPPLPPADPDGHALASTDPLNPSIPHPREGARATSR